MNDVVPSTPDPTYQQLIYVLIEATLKILGAFGVAVPILSDGNVAWAIAGALALITGVVLSLRDKYRSQRAVHAAALASVRFHAPRMAVNPKLYLAS